MLTLTLTLTLARPRIYSDLRAAASLGGYHFNWSRLEGHLEISDEVVPHDRPCEVSRVCKKWYLLFPPRRRWG